MRVALIVCALVLAATVSSAQTSITGVLGVDLVRSSHIETQTAGPPSVSGEPLTGGVRVGQALGERWGVELELARSADLRRDTTVRPPIAILRGAVLTFADGSSQTLPVPAIFPPITIEYRYRLTEHHVTFSPSVWLRQRIAGPVDVAYLAGIALTHTTSTLAISIGRGIGAPVQVSVSGPTVTVGYGINPLVGVEGHIALTDHVRVVPGVRAQGLSSAAGNGWIVRTSLGLGWTF